MGVNKVIYAGNTLIDLTNDNVTPETLAEGATAHDASGEPITGTMKTGGGLPEGGEPHQMLVTDAEGNAKWEERIIRPPEGETVEVLPECKPVVNVDEGSGDIMAAILEPIFTEDVVVGETYTVYWNGTAYKTIAQPVEEDGIVAPGLGDIGLMTGGESTGEPFVMVCMSAETGAEVGYYAVIIPLDGSTDITLKIDHGSITYHPIGLEYLPEYMYGIIEGEDIVCLPETTLAISGNMTQVTGFVQKVKAGKETIVNYNGKEYTVIPDEEALIDGFTDFGNLYVVNQAKEDTGEPFYVMLQTDEATNEYGGMVYTNDGAASITISISQSGDIIRKMPEMFMPDSVMEKLNTSNPIIKGENNSIYSDNINDNNGVPGMYAVALGFGARATGGETVAVGRDACADGAASVAIKGSAGGTYAVALGSSSSANGRFSFAAVGGDTYKDGTVAIGEGTRAYSADQVVLGKYNVADEEDKYRYIFGNGTSGAERSNVHTIDRDGNGWFAGDVYVGGESQDNGKKLATEEYVQSYIEQTILGGAW